MITLFATAAAIFAGIGMYTESVGWLMFSAFILFVMGLEEWRYNDEQKRASGHTR